MRRVPATDSTDTTDTLSATTARSQPGRFIYIACPWAPVGGGMFKVAQYLIDSQAARPHARAAQLRPLDTRGSAGPVCSLAVLAVALARIAWGRAQGTLAGVHVNTGERMSLFRKAMVVGTCRLLGVPVVLHLHAQMEGFYRGLPVPLRRLTAAVFRAASGVVVIGPTARRFVQEAMGVPPSRVEAVLNGVPCGGGVRDRAGRGDGPMRVLFLGNLSDRKGVLDLIEALAQPALEQARLQVTIAGGGNIARYRRKAHDLGLDRIVRFEGWCGPAHAYTLLQNSDVLVLPSHDEVLPLAILEALSHGLAVVATPVGELPGLLTGGTNVLFVKKGDPRSIADALQQLCHDPALMERLARNGRALYEERFSLPGFFTGVARVHRRFFGISAQLGEPPAGGRLS